MTTILLPLLLACATPDDAMTYPEFRARWYEDTCAWLFVCEGDVSSTTGWQDESDCIEDRSGNPGGWPTECYGYDVEAAVDCLAPWADLPDEGECTTGWYEAGLDEEACAVVCSNGEMWE